ncbi:MAG: RIP metalloprotease RseP [Chloroflexi bacterium]|nr:RIP metalloprotease RseP [Chloroflexota bacterium]
MNIFNIIIGVLAAVLCIGFIIFVHELGHFLAALKYGVGVGEFSMGFGPILFSKEKNGIKYNLRLFPLGGFVSIKGEEGENEDPNDPANFQNKTLWERVVIIAAGALMNYVAAIILFLIVGIFFGVMTMAPVQSPVISNVLKDKPAAQAGLKKGDIITSVNGTAAAGWENMVEMIHQNPGRSIAVVVKRGNENLTFNIVPESFVDKENGKTIGLIGIEPTHLIDLQFKKVGIMGAVYWTIEQTALWTYAPFKILIAIFSKQVPASMVAENMMGPLGIGHFIFQVVEKGVAPLIYICALISVSLGILNLLPIPALDGMRIFIMVIGAVIGKKIDPQKENLVHTIGFYCLLFLVILITKQDLVRIIQGTNYFK